MIFTWREGFRISFGKLGRGITFNLGRTGYMYWERGDKHGVIQFWRTARKNGNA